MIIIIKILTNRPNFSEIPLEGNTTIFFSFLFFLFFFFGLMLIYLLYFWCVNLLFDLWSLFDLQFLNRYLVSVPLIRYLLILRGNCTPNQNLACFVLYLKIMNTFLKELKNSIKVWIGIYSSSWVIDQNNILTVLIHNSKSAWPIKISTPFVSFLDNLL